MPRYAARFGPGILGEIEFLPVKSLEKFLKARLADRLDIALHRRINDYLLPKIVLADLVRDYRTDCANGDATGKVLFGRIEKALELHGRSREDLVELVVDDLIERGEESVEATMAFLRARLDTPGAP